MTRTWTTFPLLPVRADGTCGCRNPDCKDAGKHPSVKWGAKTLGKGVALDIPPGFGVGIATGERSGVFVVDLDRKNGLDGLAALQELGDVPPTLAVRTPSGGFHLYFKYPGFKVSNSASVLGPGIDIRGDGGYCVLPPSQHKNGGRYEWVDPGAEIVDAPTWLLKALAGKVTRAVTRDTLTKLSKQWKRAKSIERQELGEALDRIVKGESYAAPGERDSVTWALANELSRALPNGSPATLAGLFAMSLDRMEGEAAGAPTVEVVLEKLERAYGEHEDDLGGWTARLSSDKNGEPKPTIANALIVLSNHPDWQGVLAYDERRLRPLYMKEPPFSQEYAGHDRTIPRDLIDVDSIRIAAWLAEKQKLSVGKDVAHHAVSAAARQHSFDQFKQYLEALSWDRVPRLDGWLQRYAMVEDSEYTRLVGAKWLISAVARTMDPGCKVDTMLILEGEQGLMKSTLLGSLVDDAFFTDQLPDLHDKDSKQHIYGPAIIEVQELDAFNSKEATSVKSFLSVRRDRFRPPYGATTEDFARRCVFAGTTNKENYFKDETGNRRFWPVRVLGRCDVDGLRAVRDQLWAEAIERWAAGEEWWLDEQTEHLATQEQAHRQERDPWDAPIDRALEDGVRKVSFGAAPGAAEWIIPPKAASVSIAELLEHVLQIPVSAWTRSHEMRAGNTLKHKGWERRRMRTTADREYRYFRPREVGTVIPLKIPRG